MKKKAIFIIVFIVIILIIISCIAMKTQDKEEIDNNNIDTQNSEVNNIDTQDNEETNNNITNASSSTTSSNTTISNNENQNNNTPKTIVKQLSPSGFMGSSLYKVVLYSNKEVYIQTFDGNGYEKENIISEELVAKGVSEITLSDEDEKYGEVIIKGGEAINTNTGWIEFE